MNEIIIYGAGGTGRNLIPILNDRWNIRCFCDSDARKWGKYVDKYEIVNPDVVLTEQKFDYVIVASISGYDEIRKKLLEYNISENKIVDKYVLMPLEGRRQFLESWSLLFSNLPGSCAEVGVFEGNFAKHINEYFPSKKLFLFDTFEGFNKKDIEKEREYQLSEAKVGDYDNTSEELVIKKMKYPENVVIKKGYFPESAKGIEGEFCFVNLDVDLYNPTLKSLYWFKDKMVQNGVILVHDYFSDTFVGPRQAVDEFLKENIEYRKVPIGDGISILIMGF